MRAALLALLLLAPGALALPLPGEVATTDADGGRSLRLLVDDGPGGTYAYTAVNVSASKSTLVQLLRNSGNPALAQAGDAADQVDEPFTEAGAFTHAWSLGGTPMLTAGIYAVHRDEGVLRVPLVLFENVADSAELQSKVTELLLNHAPDMVSASAPFLLEMALVSASPQFASWPDAGSLDTYRDEPTVYAWVARKVAAGHEVWQGFFLAREGDWSGDPQGHAALDARKRMDLGVAARIDGATERVAAAYLETLAHKEGTARSQRTTWQLTAGLSGAAGSVPIVALRGEDVRADAQGDLYETPSSQGTGLTFGAWVQGEFVPLLGARTDAVHRKFACPPQPAEQPSPLVDCVEQTRTTSLGVFVQGSYVPLAGVRYHGERQTLDDWPLSWLATGGPGSQSVGDFQLDAGAFGSSDFIPLAGVRYDDRFAGARATFQMMLSAGIHTPVGWQPLLALTYEGGRPLVTWALGVAGDDRAQSQPWMLSAGTFAGARYAPLLGARYLPQAEGASRAQQHQVAVGAFLADYRYFVPLLGAQWDGDRGPVNWATSYALGGGPGTAADDWDLTAGLFVMDRYHPVLWVQQRDHYASPEGPAPAEQMLVIGAEAPGTGFTPLVGVAYRSDQPLVNGLASPTTFGDDTPFRVTAGVFVQGRFVPVAGVSHEPQRTAVTLLPTTY